MMKTLTGPLEKVGVTTTLPMYGMLRYNMLKVGDKVINAINAYEGMDAFVVPDPRPVTIYYVGNGFIGRWIIGMQDADGDYYQGRMPIPGLILLWLMAIVLSVIVVGLVVLPLAVIQTILALQVRRLPAPPVGKRWVTVH